MITKLESNGVTPAKFLEYVSKNHLKIAGIHTDSEFPPHYHQLVQTSPKERAEFSEIAGRMALNAKNANLPVPPLPKIEF